MGKTLLEGSAQLAWSAIGSARGVQRGVLHRIYPPKSPHIAHQSHYSEERVPQGRDSIEKVPSPAFLPYRTSLREGEEGEGERREKKGEEGGEGGEGGKEGALRPISGQFLEDSV